MKKPIKTILTIILLAIVAVAVAGFIKFNILQDDIYVEQLDGSIVKANDLEEFVLVTEEGTTALLSYTTPERDIVTLRIDRESYELKSVVSGSGSKYANEDNSVIYWEHQGEATIELAGETTYVVPTIQKADLITFNIAPEKQDCVGVTLMKCLVVNGELFYDSIEGFEFKEGTEYEIVVARTERENVPADASKYTYQRVEVLKSNKQGDPNANKYDLSPLCDDKDQDCTGGDTVCGSGTVVQDGDCVPEKLDDDDDGDSLPIEDEASLVISKEESIKNELTETSWLWKETQYSNDDLVTPSDSTQFVATFSEEGQFSSSTDCNTVGGSYAINDSNLSFGNMFATKMACMDETMEMEYSNMLGEVTSYMIADNGNLVLMLKYDSGSMIFTPQASEAQEATDYNSSQSNKSY